MAASRAMSRSQTMETPDFRTIRHPQAAITKAGAMAAAPSAWIMMSAPWAPGALNRLREIPPPVLLKEGSPGV